jgi:hypothetical protein
MNDKIEKDLELLRPLLTADAFIAEADERWKKIEGVDPEDQTAFANHMEKLEELNNEAPDFVAHFSYANKIKRAMEQVGRYVTAMEILKGE